MNPWKRRFLPETTIFRGYVSFQGSNPGGDEPASWVKGGSYVQDFTHKKLITQEPSTFSEHRFTLFVHPVWKKQPPSKAKNHQTKQTNKQTNKQANKQTNKQTKTAEGLLHYCWWLKSCPVDMVNIPSFTGFHTMLGGFIQDFRTINRNGSSKKISQSNLTCRIHVWSTMYLSAIKDQPSVLVGGWTNPFEKYARQNGFIFPK